MIKRVDPPDVDAENYGFDVSTCEGKLLYMRYWHQLEHEDDEEEFVDLEETLVSSNVEAEEVERITEEYTQEDLDEMMRQVEQTSRHDYMDALYLVLHSKSFWIVQILLTICVVLLTFVATSYFSFRR